MDAKKEAAHGRPAHGSHGRRVRVERGIYRRHKGTCGSSDGNARCSCPWVVPGVVVQLTTPVTGIVNARRERDKLKAAVGTQPLMSEPGPAQDVRLRLLRDCGCRSL